MIKSLIILPNQLFKKIEAMEIEKILLHRASMQNFYHNLKEKLTETEKGSGL